MFGTREEIEAELQRLADQFADLLAELRRARATQADTTAGDKPREAAIIALGAVLEFLTWMPEVRKERLHEPLANLRGALLDIQRRRSSDLLGRPASNGGRLRVATETQMRWVTAACATYLLMKAGLSRGEAASEVAAMLKRAGGSLQGGDPDTRAKGSERRRDEVRLEPPMSREREETDRPRAVGPIRLPKELLNKVRDVPVADATEAKRSAAVLIHWVANRYPVTGR